MSYDIRILVAADVFLANFVQEFGKLLALPAQQQQEGFERFYVLIDPHTTFTVVESDFINIKRAGGEIVPLEDYRFTIYVDDHSVIEPEKRLQWQRRRAQEAFDALKATGMYRLLLLDDNFNQLDAFTPPGQTLPPSDYVREAQGLPVRTMISTAGAPMEVIAHELETLIGTAPQVITADGETQYFFLTDQILYRLVRRQIADPSTNDYEHYPYNILIQGRATRTGERRWRQTESARTLFTRLKETGQYYLALIGDFYSMGDGYKVLEAFEPLP